MGSVTVASVVSDEGVVCVACLEFQPIKHLVIAMWKVAQSVDALGLNIVRYQKQRVRLMDMGLMVCLHASSDPLLLPHANQTR